MKFVPRERRHMASFEINTKTVPPTEAITGHIFIFAPTLILNMVCSPRSS